MSDSVTPCTAAHQAPLSKEFFRQEYWSEKPFPSPGDLPNSGIEPRSPALQADSLPAEPQGKPKNINVGGLSLLQWIFPTQELNWGLLHCRRILYQLSYQGSLQASSVMLKIHHTRLQQHVNQELPDIQAGFRKGRGTRYPIANISCIIEKARELQKNICFIDYAKAFDCVDHNKLWKILKEMGIPDH